MAVYPNARYMSLVAGRHFGPGPGLENKFRDRSDRFNIYTSETFNRTISHPQGYGMRTVTPSYSPGGISSIGRTVVAVSSYGSGTMGLSADGIAEVTIDPSFTASAIAVAQGTSYLSLLSSGEAEAIVWALFAEGIASLSATANGSATIALGTAGTASFAINSALSAHGIGWVDMQANTSVSASSQLTAKGSISGTTAEAGLSPAGIAAAVWGYDIRNLTSSSVPGLTTEERALLDSISTKLFQVQVKVDANF